MTRAQAQANSRILCLYPVCPWVLVVRSCGPLFSELSGFRPSVCGIYFLYFIFLGFALRDEVNDTVQITIYYFFFSS